MFYILALVLIVFFLASAIRVLREYERGVIFRLGRIIKTKGPGLIILIPVIDKMVKVSLRLVAMDVPSQDVITRDNVSVKVNAVIYFRVMDPTNATIVVENFLFATSQLAQTTLRSVCGQVELDELLSEREKINTQLQSIRTLGGSRLPPSRSSISICPRRCSERWPSRLRRRGSDGPR
jgi:regulator of protease activity HflC (stomatin/prohibitin superfamily)